MNEIPEDRAPDIPDTTQPGWTLLVGLVLPLALVIVCKLAIPADAGRFLGVSLASWCLFACSPTVSLCLAVCWRYGSGGKDTR